jgi:uncharacterized protein (DUF1800 family)
MFNALKYTQELEKAGFSRDQAETSVKLLIDVMNDNFATKPDLKESEMRIEASVVATKSEIRESERRLETSILATQVELKETEMRLESSILATKSEIKETEMRLESSILATRSEIKETEMRLESSIREVEYKLTIKLGAMMTLAIGVTATLMKMISS